MLDFSSLRRAIAQLEESLDFVRSETALGKMRLALQLRTAAIKAFEYTYELSIKMLIRYLQETEPGENKSDARSFQENIRLGYERGLLQAEFKDWMEFRKQRNTTSHAYDERKAEEVFLAIPAFLKEAKFLLNELESRRASSRG